MGNDEFKFFYLARRLNDYFRNKLIDNHARFRASMNSVSLISIHPLRPQKGIEILYNKLKDEEMVDIDHLFQKLSELTVPGRKTPEKLLQSNIIRTAMKLGSFEFDNNIHFITDEFARVENQGKLVLDLLGFNIKTKCAVVIELKSSRSLKQLNSQLNKAKNLLSDNYEFYRGLFKIHGYDWENPSLIECIAIWPALKSGKGKSFPLGIREISYNSDPDDVFIFHENED
jgi:hypothetical protein